MDVKIPGLTPGKIGDKVSFNDLPKLKLQKDESVRVSILSNNMWVTRTHYFDGLGSVFCFSGSCCKYDPKGYAAVRHVLMACVYTLDMNGQVVKGQEVQVVPLIIDKDRYEPFRIVHQTSGDVTQTDFVITCNDEQWQKWTTVPINEGPLYKTDEQWLGQVKAGVEFFREHIINSIGKQLTEEEFMEWYRKKDDSQHTQRELPGTAPVQPNFQAIQAPQAVPQIPQSVTQPAPAPTAQPAQPAPQPAPAASQPAQGTPPAADAVMDFDNMFG